MAFSTSALIAAAQESQVESSELFDPKFEIFQKNLIFDELEAFFDV